MKFLAPLSMAAMVALSTTAFAGDKSGSFSGMNDHIVTGGVTVTDNGDTITVTLADNFSLDGAPDPYISLAGNVNYPIENIGFLTKHKGSSTFSVKKTDALAKATHVLVWCKKFSVTLGQAKIN